MNDLSEQERSFTRGAPNAPYNWRWCLAVRYHHDGYRMTENDYDPWVEKAMRYVANFGRTFDWLRNKYPDIHDAFVIYRDSGTLRWFLEAVIVSGKPKEFIASYFNLSIGAVEAYEALFYDQRELAGLQAEGALIARMAGPGPIDPYNPDSLWKAVAREGGFDALRSLLIDGHDSPEATEYWLKVAFGRSAKNMGVMLKSLQYNGHTAQTTAMVFDSIHNKSAADTQTVERVEVTRSVGMLLESFSFELAPPNVKEIKELPGVYHEARSGNVIQHTLTDVQARLSGRKLLEAPTKEKKDE